MDEAKSTIILKQNNEWKWWETIIPSFLYILYAAWNNSIKKK